MTILALEFSSARRSVAILRSSNGSVAAEASESGGRETHAFGMIEKVLTETGIEREEIDALAIGLGPGSYTGIRAAIALAQGWQLAREIKLYGINSVECLAAQAHAGKNFGRMSVVVDAQRNEFYLAEYEITPAGWSEISPLRIVPSVEIQKRADAHEILVGPEADRWPPSGRSIFPSALTLARLAAGKSKIISGEKLEPIYLREINFVKNPSHTSPKF